MRAVNFRTSMVQVHFNGWSRRFDEWIPFDSRRLRAANRGKKKRVHVQLKKVAPTTRTSSSGRRRSHSLLGVDKAESGGDESEVPVVVKKTKKMPQVSKSDSSKSICVLRSSSAGDIQKSASTVLEVELASADQPTKSRLSRPVRSRLRSPGAILLREAGGSSNSTVMLKAGSLNTPPPRSTRGRSASSLAQAPHKSVEHSRSSRRQTSLKHQWVPERMLDGQSMGPPSLTPGSRTPVRAPALGDDDSLPLGTPHTPITPAVSKKRRSMQLKLATQAVGDDLHADPSVLPPKLQAVEVKNILTPTFRQHQPESGISVFNFDVKSSDNDLAGPRVDEDVAQETRATESKSVIAEALSDFDFALRHEPREKEEQQRYLGLLDEVEANNDSICPSVECGSTIAVSPIATPPRQELGTQAPDPRALDVLFGNRGSSNTPERWRSISSWRKRKFPLSLSEAACTASEPPPINEGTFTYPSSCSAESSSVVLDVRKLLSGEEKKVDKPIYITAKPENISGRPESPSALKVVFKLVKKPARGS